jgi:hypothetical protein
MCACKDAERAFITQWWWGWWAVKGAQKGLVWLMYSGTLTRMQMHGDAERER